MKIIRFDKRGNCQFIYFDWKEFKFKTTCWAKSIDILFGRKNGEKHIFIGLHNL